ncbi:MAG TPA: acetylglutamate kinase [Anaerolineae bacterium]|nr:acetylglutamate kinase [Anaerolineae bacterium]
MNDHHAIHVIKIGGSQIDDRDFLARMVTAIQQVQKQGVRPVIVHGGGNEIARLHDELGVPFDVVQGLRVTSDQSMRLVKMALGGIANLRIVRWLVNGGVQAIGLNGIDMGLIRVEKLLVDGVSLGRVGKVDAVNIEPLLRLLDQEVVPVIAPISLGYDGLSYNVNADHVAEALAVALNATKLVFLTDVPGVKIADRTMRVLPAEQIEDLIFGHFITGGMIPKARAAASAVKHGIPSAVITDLDHYQRGEGTFIVSMQPRQEVHTQLSEDDTSRPTGRE